MINTNFSKVTFGGEVQASYGKNAQNNDKLRGTMQKLQTDIEVFQNLPNNPLILRFSPDDVTIGNKDSVRGMRPLAKKGFMESQEKFMLRIMNMIRTVVETMNSKTPPTNDW